MINQPSDFISCIMYALIVQSITHKFYYINKTFLHFCLFFITIICLIVSHVFDAPSQLSKNDR